MCVDDSFCRCHIIEEELKIAIYQAMKLLRENGFTIHKESSEEKAYAFTSRIEKRTVDDELSKLRTEVEHLRLKNRDLNKMADESRKRYLEEQKWRKELLFDAMDRDGY